MKSTKRLSATNKKLANIPEFPQKEGLLNSLHSPKPKGKPGAKSASDKIEPMVLRSPPIGESIMRYALPIPSSKTKELLSEGEVVRSLVKHLKLVVSSLEEAYGVVTEDGEQVKEKEGISISLGDDMNSFLVCCSQFANQLEDAANEEYNILDSLFKWFQQQVNQMEEISKDPSILEEELPASEKNITLSIQQIVKLITVFERLKNHMKATHKESKPTEKDNLPLARKSYEAMEKKIEEFIKTHSTEDSESAQAPEPKTPYSVSNRLNVMIRIFENQKNMLERALNEQSVLEEKYKQMQNDFELLSEEKLMLEYEVQTLKEAEAARLASKDERSKKTTKAEAKKDKSKPEASQGKKSVTIDLKQPEELPQFQEADPNKHELDKVLNQGKEQHKSEEKSKAEVAGEDSAKPPKPGKKGKR